ncbi:MAG: iron-containing alcohol dehydrogenase, partial [Deltaproteobacteria bacterium]|nr:iron-containing alcohol dehydrogenase [Deltaproteobacteria bacterium]
MPIVFNYFNPVRLIFGAGSFGEIGERVKELGGSKALIVTGKSSAKRTGALDRLQRLLGAEGISYSLFSQVTPNPTTTLCLQGAEAARSEGCDIVIGLGGGSAMDAAKGAAFAVNNPGDLSDYIFGRRRQEKCTLPIVLVPTTCGTGSEGNSFSVLTDPATSDKKSLRLPSIFPRLSVIDPALMANLPSRVLGEAAFDAMCHLMESYLARNAQPMTDIMSLSGLSLSKKSLLSVFGGQGSADDWANIAWASTLGGMSIGPGCSTAPHGLEHPLSGRKSDISHARGLAAICPAVYERTLSGAPKEALERLDTISRILFGTSRSDFVEKLSDLIKRLGLSESLTSLGLSESDIPWLTQNAL